jgi:CHRD domain
MKIRVLAGGILAAGALLTLAVAAEAAMHPELSARLSGTHEVPKAAASGHGIVNLTLNASKHSVCWAFEGITGIGKPLVAHIHKAPVGKSGPVVVPLGGAYKAKGCTTVMKKVIDAIESNPNAYYVNVHTAKYPNGAIRGQLVAGMAHM